MGFVKHSVEDHTRPAVITAKLHAMAACPVLFARNPAKSAATIRNAASYVMGARLVIHSFGFHWLHALIVILYDKAITILLLHLCI